VSNASSFGTISSAAVGPLTTNADLIARRAPALSAENAKIEKSAKDFESILLGNWLQQAEQSFGSLPGGDDEDADAGKEQFQSMAMQSLGASMTASGGIGIAKMISKQLHKAEDAAAPGAQPMHRK
jgi:Rod binding domain-containing protein